MVFASYVLRCYIYAARHLNFIPRANVDKSVIPNPYVRVSCAGCSDQTEVAPSTRFPVWTQCLPLRCRLALDAYEGIPAVTPVTVEVVSARLRGNGKWKEELILGRSIATYTRVIGKLEVKKKQLTTLRPEWLELKRDVTEQPVDPVYLWGYASSTRETPIPVTKCGDVLVALELLRAEDARVLTPSRMLPNVETVPLRIGLWGLRMLLAPPAGSKASELAHNLNYLSRRNVFGDGSSEKPHVRISFPDYTNMVGEPAEISDDRVYSDTTNIRSSDRTLDRNESWRTLRKYGNFNFKEGINMV